MKALQNVAAERAVLAGLCHYGISASADVEGVLEPSSFVSESNQIIFKCVLEVLKNSDSVDISSILSAASSLNFYEILDTKKEIEFLRALFNFPINLENVRPNAIKIRKLQLGREIQITAKQIHSEASHISGEESFDEIICLAENPVFNISSMLGRGEHDRPTILGEDIEEYIEHLMESPCEMIGLSSGFSRYDAAIGGGFRRKAVDLIAARPKVGKSVFGDVVAMHIANNLDAPVLMLDTEMSKEDHQNRLLASLSGVPINDIATGKFSYDQSKTEKINLAKEKLKEAPYHYINISGKPFDQTLSIIRRWILKEIGYDENGRVNDCMIIYDYLKLMTSDHLSNNVAEFQALGFQITALHNFCVEYDCPCLAFVQLNRDGITKESTDVVSGSDRLIWLCTSFSIFKEKSIEEKADHPDAGNRKLVPIVTRHGPGMDNMNYINMSMEGETARIKEGFTRDELFKQSRSDREGFEVKDDGPILQEDGKTED